MRRVFRALGLIGWMGAALIAIAAIALSRQPMPQEPGAGAPSEGTRESTVATSSEPGSRVDQAPSPSCEDGYLHLVTFDRAVETIDGETAVAEAVGLVRLLAISEGKLSAVDSARPVLPGVASASPVYRTATFEAITVTKGDAATLETVRVYGGTVGCDTWEYAGVPDLVVGRQYLVFGQRLVTSDGRTMGELTAASIWPVDADGSIATPADGRLTVDQALNVSR